MKTWEMVKRHFGMHQRYSKVRSECLVMFGGCVVGSLARTTTWSFGVFGMQHLIAVEAR